MLQIIIDIVIDARRSFINAAKLGQLYHYFLTPPGEGETPLRNTSLERFFSNYRFQSIDNFQIKTEMILPEL